MFALSPNFLDWNVLWNFSREQGFSPYHNTPMSHLEPQRGEWRLRRDGRVGHRGFLTSSLNMTRFDPLAVQLNLSATV